MDTQIAAVLTVQRARTLIRWRPASPPKVEERRVLQPSIDNAADDSSDAEAPSARSKNPPKPD